MCETWKRGSSLDGSGGIFTKTSFRNSGWRQEGSRLKRGNGNVCRWAGLPAYRFVHLQLYVGLEAEELVGPGGGELLGAVCEEEEIAEEESPQLPAAFGLVQTAAVQQLARPEAVSQRVEDQVLEENASTRLSLGSPPSLRGQRLDLQRRFTSMGPSHWTCVCIHSSLSEFSFSLTPSLTWEHSSSARSRASLRGPRSA